MFHFFGCPTWWLLRLNMIFNLLGTPTEAWYDVSLDRSRIWRWTLWTPPLCDWTVTVTWMYTALLLFGFFILKKKGIGKDWPKKINKLSIPCSSLRQADINLLEREDARRLHWAPVLIGSDLRSYPHPMSLDPGTSDVSLLAMETALSPSSPRWMTTAWTSWTGIVQLGGLTQLTAEWSWQSELCFDFDWCFGCYGAF